MNDAKNLEYVGELVNEPILFRAAIAAIDGENSQDPKRIGEEGYELYFSKVLFDWVLKLEKTPSEALLLATRSQHICRWHSPRLDYPEGRVGYLKWRSDLKTFHAEKSGEVLKIAGYGEDILDRVRDLNLKRNLKSDPECQVLEDALCLVFLEKQFAKFREKTDEAKMVDILRKSWAKMSEVGRAAALELPMGEDELRLVKAALAG
tara:strand:+ start:407 stop:1024 length:618 start_codon:yes stop_codon:yes gene_type:complete